MVEQEVVTLSMHIINQRFHQHTLPTGRTTSKCSRNLMPPQQHSCTVKVTEICTKLPTPSAATALAIIEHLLQLSYLLTVPLIPLTAPSSPTRL